MVRRAETTPAAHAPLLHYPDVAAPSSQRVHALMSVRVHGCRFRPGVGHEGDYSELRLPEDLRSLRAATPAVRLHSKSLWLATSKIPDSVACPELSHFHHPSAGRLCIGKYRSRTGDLRLMRPLLFPAELTCSRDVRPAVGPLAFGPRNATRRIPFARRLLKCSSRSWLRLAAKPRPLKLRAALACEARTASLPLTRQPRRFADRFREQPRIGPLEFPDLTSR